ncbi:MAG: DUF6979 family protein [Cetobacterium sp.]|uniref:DUF6979 family protein n=1 Tax=Cetobacterium sp. TaxID=2071632 RepID=UPI003EE6F3A1
MNKFELVAIMTYGELKNYSGNLLKKEEVQEIWMKNCKKVGLAESTSKKGCPKNAFLGVIRCISLKLKIDWGTIKINKNQNYAMEAIRKIKEINKIWRPLELWKAIDKQINHDGQMNIVLILWEKGMIE